MFFIYYVIAIIAVIVLILLIRIQAIIKIENTQIRLSLVLFGILKFKRQFVIVRQRKKIYTLYQIDKRRAKELTTLRKIIRDSRKTDLTDSQKHARRKTAHYILAHIRLKFETNMSIGASDAYLVAMMSGIVNIALGIVKARFSKPMHQIQFNIVPVFSKRLFSIDTNCIITISPANIILGYMIYKKHLRR